MIDLRLLVDRREGHAGPRVLDEGRRAGSLANLAAGTGSRAADRARDRNRTAQFSVR
jgi:hypothetical protein